MEDELHLRDPQALRAYAHPTRIALVGLLRREGPFTATRAAELTGESVASCSYHLRMLAKYGLIEEAPGGHGREKPWRAPARLTSWPEYSEDPAVSEAARELSVAFAERHFTELTHWLEHKGAEPKKWQEAAQLGDNVLYLTASELKELGNKVWELLQLYADRLEDPRQRPKGARRVTYVHFAHPAR